MNFFKSLFGNSQTTKPTSAPTFVDERLFISHEEPVEEAQPQTTHTNSLNQILRRDFEKEGFCDGYEVHNVDLLTNRMDSMVAEFRLVYRTRIKQVDDEIAKLQPFLMDKVREHMPEQYIRIQTQSDSLKLESIALKGELDLAQKREGFIEKAICDYRMGFEKGFALYFDERLLTNRFMNP